MEYIQSGGLAAQIKSGLMTERDAKTITLQLLEGLVVMHQHDFYHRDLKPEYILMASLSHIVVKISDFGISKQGGDNTVLRTFAGTDGYTAPEILGFLSIPSSTYTTAVDIWSLGCLIYTILIKKMPFLGVDTLHDYTQSQAAFPNEKYVNRASPMAISFINRLMMPHPDNRPTARQALGDPWFNAVEDGDSCSPCKDKEGGRERRQKRIR